MDLTILEDARRAGLAVFLDADGRVVVRGPRRLGHLAKALLAHRDAVAAALRAEKVPIREAGLAPDPGPRPDAGLMVWRPSPQEFLGTLAAQSCHPGVLASRLGMPVGDVVQQLITSRWAWHGRAVRARLGYVPQGEGHWGGPAAEGPASRPPQGMDLHFPAR